jgi:hypothetical protein
MSKLSVHFSDQARKTIRSVAGSMDTTASGLIRSTIRENLERIDLSKPKD